MKVVINGIGGIMSSKTLATDKPLLSSPPDVGVEGWLSGAILSSKGWSRIDE